MQHFGWVLFVLMAVGPVAVGLLLDRLRLGRAVSLAGVLAAAAGAAVLLSQEPMLRAGVASLAEGRHATGVSASQHRPSPAAADEPAKSSIVVAATAEFEAKLQSERTARETASREAAALREQVASLVAERAAGSAASTQLKSDLEAERAAHAKDRRELGAVRGHLASLEASVAKSEPARAMASGASAASGNAAAEFEAERKAHQATSAELLALRGRLAAVENSQAKVAETAETNALAVLDSERVAHEKTRVALRAVEEQVAALEASRKRLADEQASFAAERQELAETRARLVLAEASIARLEAASRSPVAAAPAADTAPLASVPQPFSAQPAPPATAPAAKAPDVRSNASAASEPVAIAKGPTTELGRKLGGGLTTRQFVLAALASPEFVQGRQGSFYRITCRDAASGKRLIFDAGAFALSGGDAGLDACFKSLQQAVIAQLPANTERKLFVQGFVSPSGFVKPQKMPATEGHLANVDYLPFLKDAGQFAAKPIRQSVSGSFANKELPVLRAAYVGDWIGNATKSTLKAELLEGETKPSGDDASRSFDLVLYVKW